MLNLDKKNLYVKKIIMAKKRFYIMIKGSISQYGL